MEGQEQQGDYTAEHLPLQSISHLRAFAFSIESSLGKNPNCDPAAVSSGGSIRTSLQCGVTRGQDGAGEGELHK